MTQVKAAGILTWSTGGESRSTPGQKVALKHRTLDDNHFQMEEEAETSVVGTGGGMTEEPGPAVGMDRHSTTNAERKLRSEGW